MNRERFDEIRSIIKNLRKAESGAEMAPRLLSDARYAILELLDEYKSKSLAGTPLREEVVAVMKEGEVATTSRTDAIEAALSVAPVEKRPEFMQACFSARKPGNFDADRV